MILFVFYLITKLVHYRSAFDIHDQPKQCGIIILFSPLIPGQSSANKTLIFKHQTAAIQESNIILTPNSQNIIIFAQVSLN